MLTMMDCATRFPEAVPLRRIDADTVAGALCNMFTKYGIPEEVLSDQGSQFKSALMGKVMDLLGVQQLRTSPYHPQTNGSLERFHGTLKSMMKKADNASKNWDELLPFLCFEYRDAAHEATGFSPFQLLFGRTVRGPLSLLYEQLTGETTGSQPVVEYVNNLKQRLRHAWKIAQELDSKVKESSKAYQDKTSEPQSFQPGDEVLVFLPGEDKISPQWHGPYTVKEKIGDLSYRIFMPEKRKKLRQCPEDMQASTHSQPGNLL